MIDPRIEVDGTHRNKSKPFVQAKRLNLRAELCRLSPTRRRLQCRADERRTQPTPTLVLQNADTANLGRSCVKQDPSGPDRYVAIPCQKVQRLSVKRINFICF